MSIVECLSKVSDILTYYGWSNESVTYTLDLLRANLCSYFIIQLNNLLLPVYYYCFWLFNFIDFFFILVTSVDLNLLFFLTIIFLFFLIYFYDFFYLIFYYDFNAAVNKNTCSLLIFFRVFFLSLTKNITILFYKYLKKF